MDTNEGKFVLEVCNFPATMDSQTIKKFILRLGADLLYTKRRRNKRTVFIASHSPAEAADLLHTLHQLQVFDCTLEVRYCDVKRIPLKYLPAVPAASSIGQSDKQATVLREQCRRIARAVDSTAHVYPSTNRMLRYRYPSINETTLRNIADVLVSEPSFYTQVLHLMNKMNLPAPFLLRPQVSDIRLPESATAEKLPDRSSSDESELSTDTELIANDSEDGGERKHSLLPRKRKRRAIIAVDLGEVKRVRSTVKAKPSEVFDGTGRPVKVGIVVADVKPRELDSSATSNPPTDSTSTSPTDVGSADLRPVGAFGRMAPLPKPPQKTSDCESSSSDDDASGVKGRNGDFISGHELRRGRMHADDLDSIAAFRSYERGQPSMRLYVKNLAKQVTEKDMIFIYGRYIDWSNSDEKLAFDVQLMQRGRMKGQCFVTLPSEVTAARARRETHTFELHGRPMAVSFAHSQKPS